MIFEKYINKYYLISKVYYSPSLRPRENDALFRHPRSRFYDLFSPPRPTLRSPLLKDQCLRVSYFPPPPWSATSFRPWPRTPGSSWIDPCQLLRESCVILRALDPPHRPINRTVRNDLTSTWLCRPSRRLVGSSHPSHPPFIAKLHPNAAGGTPGHSQPPAATLHSCLALTT